MTIGVDIDGVICNLDRYVRVKFEKYLKSKGVKVMRDKTKPGFCNQYGVAAEIEDEFWEKYNFHYAKHVSMRANASVVLRKLKARGHKIVIITARYKSVENNDTGEKMRSEIKKWLAKHKIAYDEIFFANDKVNIVAANKIDVMIEDSVQNILDISKLVPVIIFRNPANCRFKDKNRLVANSWRDVFGIVQDLEKKDETD